MSLSHCVLNYSPQNMGLLLLVSNLSVFKGKISFYLQCLLYVFRYYLTKIMPKAATVFSPLSGLQKARLPQETPLKFLWHPFIRPHFVPIPMYDSDCLHLFPTPFLLLLIMPIRAYILPESMCTLNPSLLQ